MDHGAYSNQMRYIFLGISLICFDFFVKKKESAGGGQRDLNLDLVSGLDLVVMVLI